MKINLGAGYNKFDNFVSCDYDASTNPDYVFDLEKDRFPFDDNSVDEVIAHHVLEHLGEGYFHCMQELYRVCQNNVVISIRVPHPRHYHFLADPTHRRPILPEGLWLFSKKQNDISKSGKNASSCLGHYFNVDFEVLDVINVPDENYIKHFEGKLNAEVEQYMHEHNNIIQEIVIKLLVIK